MTRTDAILALAIEVNSNNIKLPNNIRAEHEAFINSDAFESMKVSTLAKVEKAIRLDGCMTPRADKASIAKAIRNNILLSFRLCDEVSELAK